MGETKICDISDEVREELRKFRFRKEQDNAALILKIDRESHRVIVDQLLEDCSVEELADSLASHQPRYIIYSYKMQHEDRISFPMVFIFFTPRDSQIELQLQYAGTKIAFQREADLTKVFEIRELEDLTEEWLKEKLR